MNQLVPAYLTGPGAALRRTRVPAGARKAITAEAFYLGVSVDLGGDCPDEFTAGRHFDVDVERMEVRLTVEGFPVRSVDGPWPANPGLTVEVEIASPDTAAAAVAAVQAAARACLVAIERTER